MEHICAITCMWRSEDSWWDSWWDSVLSCHMNLGDQTQFIRLGDKLLLALEPSHWPSDLKPAWYPGSQSRQGSKDSIEVKSNKPTKAGNFTDAWEAALDILRHHASVWNPKALARSL